MSNVKLSSAIDNVIDKAAAAVGVSTSHSQASQTAVPSTFNAIVYTKGLPVHTAEIPVPKPGNDDVLVHVQYSSINPVDWKLAVYDFFQTPKPVVLGFDVAGTVAAVGSNVTHVAAGDPVVGYAYLTGNGAWAEGGKGGYTLVHKDLLAKVTNPTATPLKDLGTYAVAYLTAYDGIIQYDGVKPNESVYVVGGAGGVAHFAIQLAKTRTSKILTSGSKPETIAFGKQLGAAEVFNYKTDNALDVVNRFTNNQLLDVVYDTTYSPESFRSSVKLIKNGGKLIIIGELPKDDDEAAQYAKSHNIQLIQSDLIRYFFNEKQYPKPILRKAFEHAQELYVSGAVKPYIGASIKSTVSEINAALEASKNNQSPPGKVSVSLVY